jgi:hypothetical protein
MINKVIRHRAIIISFLATLAACSNEHSSISEAPPSFVLKDREVVNTDSAYIPAQCYAKVKQNSGHVSNPCYGCHVDGVRPNFLHDDSGLQQSLDFSEYSSINRYSNLFKDRSVEVNNITDDAINVYISKSNYFDDKGEIKLAKVLQDVPENWDANQDGQWNGFIPDTYFNFNQAGFDIDPQGNPTGWVAFSYFPFLGGFMPTNGSTDDVLIRLPEVFRQNIKGEFDGGVYKLNLAIVESLIREKNMSIAAVNEVIYGVDINKNGTLDVATEVVYGWSPLNDVTMSFVGKAENSYARNQISAGLYPKGTEFLHSVRYINTEDNKISMANRLKELRYSVKSSWNNYAQLSRSVSSELKERHDFPNRLSQYHSPRKAGIEAGLINGRGWKFQGFIEDKQGELRPQNHEVTFFCMGCHTGVGATTDSSFAFPRKFGADSFRNGFYHWSDKGLEGIEDPVREDGHHEYTYYLQNTLTADEFGGNDEVAKKFLKQGKLIPEKVEELKHDISLLLLPSVERATQLNKAYKVIVNEQSYVYGRDPHVLPLENIHKTVPIGEETGVTKAITANNL